MGKHYPAYHCARRHKYYQISLAKFNETITNFAANLRFSIIFRERFKLVVLEEWQKRRETARDDSISAEQRVLGLKEESKLIVEKVKILTSEVAIGEMEAELDRIESETPQAIQFRDKKRN
ncbi:hypothetical protein A2V80_02760 [Candidatus Woesebacteria bacterium RBG_16_39_8b]|uniref:Recombinase zinc beta ribbon domain-containing protein n=1 Tax=Candidatus Woesebacteria bacterium RBG_16_39_8b TaxID=1802482 RepID=A0A1F7XBI1_9BACT|nr:MAG: hypothetical protein A2V80_02760 [Candidatus Woesebacteria bacterium RBG_16_39_8b]